MRHFYTFLIKFRIPIVIIFGVMFGICYLLSNLVSVNYDINDYLPESSPSTVALDVMEDEFGGGITNARVMIPNVTIPEALEYKEKLKDVDGVSEVTWLDDSEDITTPYESLDKDALDTYYVDNNALFSVTIDDDKRIEAVEALNEIAGEEGALTGSAVSTAYTTTNTISEVSVVVIVAVLFVLGVLVITTDSWLEPIVVMVGLGVGIIINNGTNIIFGEISFVTNAAGSILQLAVSLDYSVFLIHRFVECRQETDNVKDAMVNALCKSTMSIFSSGVTTVIGFLALALMQFKLGPDMGLALAKGVAISLISVFVFMPCFILLVYKLMDKTHHRSFMPKFRHFGSFIHKVMIPLVCIFVIVIVPAYLASNANSYYYGSSHILGKGTDYGDDTEKIESIFGKSDTYVLLVPKGDTATETKLSQELNALPQVKDVISYVDLAGAEVPDSYLENSDLIKLESEHYSRLVISAQVDYEGDEAFALVETIRGIAQKYYPDTYYMAGQGVSTYDLMDTITADMTKVNLIAIAAVFVVLLISLRSIVLPIILVLCIETAIWINLSFPYFSGDVIFYIAYLIISSIQLGATVDYAILMTDRYRENRQTMEKKEAIIHTISDVTVSILTSGSVLAVVGFLMGIICSNKLLSQLGIFIGRGSVCSLIIVFFVLPGLLYLLDKIIIHKKKFKLFHRKKKNEPRRLKHEKSEEDNSGSVRRPAYKHFNTSVRIGKGN